MLRNLVRKFSSLKSLKEFNKNFEFEKTIAEYGKGENFEKGSYLKATKQYYIALKNWYFFKSKDIFGMSQLHFLPEIHANDITVDSYDFIFICLLLFCGYIFYQSYSSSKNISDNYLESLRNRSSVFASLSSKHFLNYVNSTYVKFSDVLGIDECRAELEELVEFLKDPKKFTDVGARIPKGVLLTGSPGTGKTLLAKAVAGEAGVKFFYCSGSDFDEMFVGLGSQRMRELFTVAKNSGPCILFIDEIDSLAAKRNLSHGGSSRQTLNQLLVEMDGFDTNDSVIVIAATNFPESLDKAILRSGRFDKIIDLPVPDYKGRLALFELYAKKVKCVEGIKFDMLAKKTIGMTGAEISNLVNIAALQAVYLGKNICSLEDFDYALDRIRIGIENRSYMMTEEDIKGIAYHEAGHALMAYYTKGAGELYKITILPRGPSLGHTSVIDKKEKFEISSEDILAKIDTMMGGRAAEELIRGNDDVTLGCSSDFKNATQLAYTGMSFGLFRDKLSAFIPNNFDELSEDMRNKIDLAILNLLKDRYQKAVSLLSTKKSVLTELATELIKNETMSSEQILKCIKKIEN